MKMHCKRAALLLMGLLVIASTAACQPTPTTPPVVGKGNLEEKIKDKPSVPAASAAASASTASSQTPEKNGQRVQGTYSQGKLTVKLNATLELPGTDKIPVIKVVPYKFTQADADNVVKVLLQGKQAFKPQEQPTKAEISKQLLDMKAMKSQAKDDADGKALSNKVDTVIRNLEEQLKTAPDKVDPVPSDGKLTVLEDGATGLDVTANLGKAYDARLSIYSSKSGKMNSVWYNDEPSGEGYRTDDLQDGAPKGVTLGRDEAIARAQQVAEALGTGLKLAYCGACSSFSQGKKQTDDAAKQAWVLVFTREVNGVPSIYEVNTGEMLPQEEIDRQKGGGDQSGEKSFVESHAFERLLVVMDDTGIAELQWSSPDKVTDTVSADAQTIPFEQVMSTFQQQFFIRNALLNRADDTPYTVGGKKVYLKDYAVDLRNQGFFTLDSIGYGDFIENCTYTIDRITLGMMRVAVKDKPDEFMMIPVWDFFGGVQVEYTPESGYKGFTVSANNTSFLTVNAIDGSVVDRRYGH